MVPQHGRPVHPGDAGGRLYGAGTAEDAARQATFVRQRYPAFLRDGFGSLLRDPAHREKLTAGPAKAGL